MMLTLCLCWPSVSTSMMVPQVLSALEVAPAKGGAGAQHAGFEIHEKDGMAIRVVEGAHSTLNSRGFCELYILHMEDPAP